MSEIQIITRKKPGANPERIRELYWLQYGDLKVKNPAQIPNLRRELIRFGLPESIIIFGVKFRIEVNGNKIKFINTFSSRNK